MDKDAAKTCVIVLAIIGFIGAAALAIRGLQMTILGLKAGAIFSSSLFGNWIIMGIVLIGFGVFEFFVARGMLKFKNWARTTQLVLVAIGVVWNLWHFAAADVGSIIVGAAVFYLLVFEKSIVRLFR